MKKLCAVVFAIMLSATAVQAHVSDVEGEDASFSSPKILTDPSHSQVVYAYLGWFDIDVYEFTVPPAMRPIMDDSIPPQIIGWEPIMIPMEVPILDADGHVVMDYTQSPPVPVTVPVLDEYGAPVMAPLAEEQFLINAQALPPACTEYENTYLSVGLFGPGLPDYSNYPAFPGSSDPGYGLLMAINNPVAGAERPIYTIFADEMNHEVDEVNAEGCNAPYLNQDESLSLYLPHGLTQECLHCNPWTCDNSNALTWYAVYAGTYKIVVFNNSGMPADYVLSQGIEESFTCEELELTIDLLKQAAGGQLFQISNCTSAGDSGFTGCAAPPF